MWFFLAFLAAFLYAWMWLFARMSRGVPSAIVTASMMCWAPPLLLWMLPRVEYPWGEWWWQLYLVWIAVCISFALRLLTFSSQRALVTVVNPLAALSTLATLLVSVMLFGQTFSAVHITGIAVITGGLLLLYHGQWRVWHTPWPWLTLLGVLILGVNVALLKEVLIRFPYPIAFVAVDATIVFLVNAAAAGRQWFHCTIPKRVWLLLAVFAGVTFLQEVSTVMAVDLGPAPHVVAVKRTSILIAAALSYFLLKEQEQPLRKLLLASGVVVMGVVMLAA